METLLCQPLHSLVINTEPPITKRNRNTPVTVSSMIFFMNLFDFSFYLLIFICFLVLLAVVVVSAAGKLRQLKQRGYVKSMP